MAQTRTGEGLQIPQYDPALVGAVAARVEIRGIELVQATFSRSDPDFAVAVPLEGRHPDRYGLDIKWSLATEGTSLLCVITFATVFDSQPSPYDLRASFRLDYAIVDGPPLAQEQLDNFAYWNARFNAWPYWREYLSSTINRAGLPRFVVPLMGVPRAT